MSRLTRTQSVDKKDEPKPVFPARLTIRFDEDVQVLATESFKTVAWLSFQHAVNAAMRQAFHKFAPPGVPLCISTFEQLALAKKLNIQKLIKKLSTKRARK